MRRRYLGGMVLGAGLVVGGTAFGQGSHDAGIASSVEVDTKTVREIERDSATVKFAPGSSDLAAVEKDKLRSLVDAAKKQAATEKFIIAAWSDKEYPAEGAELSEAERDLAAKRGEAVKDALKDLKAGSIDTYSMATHPTWLSSVFHTESSDIKTGEGRTTEKNKVATEIGQKLRSQGGPGRAVVVVRFKGQVSSH